MHTCQVNHQQSSELSTNSGPFAVLVAIRIMCCVMESPRTKPVDIPKRSQQHNQRITTPPLLEHSFLRTQAQLLNHHSTHAHIDTSIYNRTWFCEVSYQQSSENSLSHNRTSTVSRTKAGITDWITWTTTTSWVFQAQLETALDSVLN